MLNLNNFEVLTFDCYGTLIDWETGIFSALKPMLLAHGKALPDAQLLEWYGEFEAAGEAGSYRGYRQVLAGVVKNFGERLDFVPTQAELRSLADGLPSWQPWPDTIASLQKLQKLFRLAVISNIDDDLFSKTQKLLGIEFAHVMTAQRAGCYKPGLAIFEKALKQTGVSRDRILHVGQSLYHDIRPAQTLGISTVWVNRPSPRKDVGAVLRAEAVPDLEVPSMKALSEALHAN
jgi:2-haloacid dehalogenase